MFEFGFRHHSQHNIGGFFDILTVSTYTILPNIVAGLVLSITNAPSNLLCIRICTTY